MLCLFLAFTPTLLVIKFITRKPAWWLILLLTVLLGWGLVIGVYIVEQNHISELIDQGRNDELPQGWDSDGASGLFAVFGGWIVALVYLLSWLVFYSLATIVRRLFKPRNH